MTRRAASIPVPAVKRHSMSRSRAFTIVELVVVIVLLSILCGVALPAYYNFASQSRVSACKGVLGGVRTGIIQYHASHSAVYPTYAQLMTVGLVSSDEIPHNPYTKIGGVRNADGEWTNGTPPVNGPEGWSYDQSVGKFWANSNVLGENDY